MSPWTRSQVRYLESIGSPLTASQKSKMNRELHENPALGHQKKGSKAMAQSTQDAPQTMKGIKGVRIEVHKGEDGKVTGHSVHHEFEPKGSKSGAFLERPPEATHLFGPKGQSLSGGMDMVAHLKKNLGIGAAPSPKTEEAELKPSEPEGHEAGEYESDEEGE